MNEKANLEFQVSNSKWKRLHSVKVVIQKKIRKIYLLYVNAYKLSYEKDSSLTLGSIQAHTQVSPAFRSVAPQPQQEGCSAQEAAQDPCQELVCSFRDVS